MGAALAASLAARGTDLSAGGAFVGALAATGATVGLVAWAELGLTYTWRGETAFRPMAWAPLGLALLAHAVGVPLASGRGLRWFAADVSPQPGRPAPVVGVQGGF